jgi:hypothetical protein
MTTGGGEGGRRLAADLEQDLARLLAWGASPPSCSRSAHPAWPAPRGPSFIRRGGEKEEEREREELLLPLQGGLHRLEGKRKRKRKRTSRPLPFLFKEKEKPSTSRFAVLKERGGGGRRKGPLGLEEIASFWMRE